MDEGPFIDRQASMLSVFHRKEHVESSLDEYGIVQRNSFDPWTWKIGNQNTRSYLPYGI